MNVVMGEDMGRNWKKFEPSSTASVRVYEIAAIPLVGSGYTPKLAIREPCDQSDLTIGILF